MSREVLLGNSPLFIKVWLPQAVNQKTLRKVGGNLLDHEKAHQHLRKIRTHTINKNRRLQSDALMLIAVGVAAMQINLCRIKASRAYHTLIGRNNCRQRIRAL